jgi:hypothetical protein
MTVPYRQQAEPSPIPKELRRWYTKQNDVEKGPFDRRAIARSLRDGRLRPTTLVRGEFEIEWHPLESVAELRPKTDPNRFRRDFDPSRDLQHATGTFGGGFAAGFFGGLIGYLIVRVVSKGQEETLRGARLGFFVQVVVGVILRVSLFTVTAKHP